MFIKLTLLPIYSQTGSPIILNVSDIRHVTEDLAYVKKDLAEDSVENFAAEPTFDPCKIRIVSTINKIFYVEEEIYEIYEKIMDSMSKSGFYDCFKKTNL
jgi:hypothetical protein